MSVQKFRQLLQTTINQANQKDPREIGTLAHLLIYCLERNYRYQSNSNTSNDADILSGVINDLKLEIKKYAIFSGNSQQNNFLVSYDLETAVSNYENFTKNYPHQRRLTDNIIYWLLEGDFNDNFFKFMP